MRNCVKGGLNTLISSVLSFHFSFLCSLHIHCVIMFRERIKKEHPPGTFIPTPARFCAILQLCIAFTLLLWYISQPFVGEIFTIKSRLLFYQDVMGIPPNDHLSPDRLERLKRNADRFHALPPAKQVLLSQEMAAIQSEFQRSFWSKLDSVFRIFVFHLSGYEILWLLFSIIIPIMLLKRVEGAAQAVWLLPLLVALYAADNRYYGHPVSPSADALLFPSEQELVAGYVDGALSQNVFEQQEQLMLGWQRFLVKHWTKQTPSADPAVLAIQAEEGEYAFTLERLRLRALQGNAVNSRRHDQQPLALLAFYFFWNAFFAYTAWKHTRLPYRLTGATEL